jgi:hypothetical protein
MDGLRLLEYASWVLRSSNLSVLIKGVWGCAHSEVPVSNACQPCQPCQPYQLRLKTSQVSVILVDLPILKGPKI